MQSEADLGLLEHSRWKPLTIITKHSILDVAPVLDPPLAIGAKRQVRTEEIRVKLKLFELCLMPVILHELAAWGKILKREIEEIERMQSKALKQLLQVPISTSTAGVLMETGIWPPKEYLHYSTMMLYHSTINSDEEHIAKNIVKEPHKYNLQPSF